MDDRRDRLNLLGYTYMAVLVISYSTDAAGTVCSDTVTDETDVLNMCEDGTAVGGRVVIDTYGSSVYRQDGGSINCSCTATLTELSGGTMTNAEFGSVQSLYPQSGCGSDFTLIPQLQTFPETQVTHSCTVTSITFNIVKSSDTFTVVWQSGVSGSTSGYCFSLSAGAGSVLSTKCSPRSVTTQRPSVVTSTPSPTSSSTTAMTSVVPTSITNPTTTITSSVGGIITSSTKPTKITEVTTLADQITDGDLDSIDSTICTDLVDSSGGTINVAVVVLIVVTLLVGVLVTVANVILYKRRLALVTELNASTHGMTSADTVHYDSIDQARVEPPNTYEEMSTGQTYVNTAMGT